ncbi:aminopeptidase N [Pseudoalteromonas ruthenica]|uniref:aminopeptidase N n=1 Tax=Pseudoalteromonas ruthenica TaxID=151081 RepID=UPI00110AA496|nr:aminopeptidase N [Pseudoalteromonas ruthenica]TMO44560.1 aminopeptidase N [Pseudoalteromonas ruthenica]TMO51182.1 aminopeptidase N [Pseudoalteromonas ruthenica]
MTSQHGNAKYLKDYQPPHFFIDTLTLDVDLQPTQTTVYARSEVRRNEATPANDLVLDGIDLTLKEVKVDGHTFTNYDINDEQLLLRDVPQHFVLEITTACSPQTNSSLEGLYLSDGAYCTQCEAEGFRKITYFLDRPDVMAEYEVTIKADKAQFPYLLSNGNKIASGDLADGRHFATWHDPFKKPSYLFALVAGDFDVLRDSYTTVSGREVALELYVDKGNLSKAPHAMASLKRAMQWDEQRFNLEYDLDVYMIVAVDFFNMGAMENKGLNVFNSKCVLANAETSTDRDFHLIESIVGHEYFHNWTGNRVTCRDWFQLSLKEGLTVFRDQEFSSDLGSRALNRIDAVKVMRTHQFAEDAGPMAHPIRPEKVLEMNNFYTVTVYDKGAEVIRMLHTLLGEQGFQKGMQCYIERHDGQAVTCDDFISAMSDANGFDASQFKRWYSQSGTPQVHVQEQFDAQQQQYVLTLSQHHSPTADQPSKDNLLIPVAIELLDSQGKALSLNAHGVADNVLQLHQSEQQFVFDNITERPVAVLFEDFSAPVKVQFEQSLNDQLHIVRHASSDFSRWDAQQSALSGCILDELGRGEKAQLDEAVLATLSDLLNAALAGQEHDLALVAELLQLPSFDTLSAHFDQVPVDAITAVTEAFAQQIAEHLQVPLSEVVTQLSDDKQQSQQSVAKRALLATCMGYLARVDTQLEFIETQAHQGSMTLSLAAIKALILAQHPRRGAMLDEFAARWQHDTLVMDKWFNLQALRKGSDSFANLTRLYQHPHFSWRNPNRVRALIGAFAMSNPTQFHAKDGQGYALLGDALVKLNDINPQNASRLITPLLAWRRFDRTRQQLMKEQLERLKVLPKLSKDLFEKVDKALSE